MTRKMCLPLGVNYCHDYTMLHCFFLFGVFISYWVFLLYYSFPVSAPLLSFEWWQERREEEGKEKEREREREYDRMIVWWLEAILLIHRRVRSHVWTWWRMLHFTRMFWILTWMASEFTLDGLPWKKPDLKKMMARGMDCFQESSLLPSKIVSLFS